MNATDKWDVFGLKEACLWSTRSKDPSRKVGAVVKRNGRTLSTGYNGFPRGIRDTKKRLNTRDIKHQFMVHAEANAIYNAAYEGISLKDSTLYVYGLPPCSHRGCAMAIIQSGIKRVVMPEYADPLPEEWQKSWEHTEKMFLEAGVEYEFCEDYRYYLNKDGVI